MKRALVIRHTPYEGIAGFRQPVESAGYVIDRVDVTDPSFAHTDFLAPDLVVLMGGPMGVYERAAHPWIDREVEALAARLDRRLPVLGVCLGAQMIAAALGARVFPGPVKEVGFAPITLSASGHASPVRHLAEVPVLHWHGDTFDLPEGTELLASSAHYAHQAYRRGPELLALQCHPEMGEDARFGEWLEDEAYLALAGTHPAAMRQAHDAHGPRAVAAGRAVVGEWLAGL